MSIIIRNSQLNDETIAALNKLVDVDINASVAFKLMRIIKEISSIVEDKNKMEQMIINKHSEKDEDGKPVQANFGVNTWTDNFNESQLLFNKRYKPNQSQYMPNYQQMYSVTGEFTENGPLASNY